jgi:hypothetical protein
MKHFASTFFAAFLLICQCSLRAQVAINTDGSTPDPSAMLDVKSTVRGVLVTRMTSAQRTAIVTPADGLWVYDTDTKTFWYYQGGTGWVQVLGSSGAFSVPLSLTFSSPSILLSLANPGTGGAISGSSTGGTALYGATSAVSQAGLLSDNLAGGEAVVGRTLTTSSATAAVVGRNDGPGYGVQGFISADASGNGIGVLGQVGLSSSTGVAGHFENTNTANPMTALEA